LTVRAPDFKPTAFFTSLRARNYPARKAQAAKHRQDGHPYQK